MKEKKENNNTASLGSVPSSKLERYNGIIAYFNNRTEFKKIDRLNSHYVTMLDRVLERYTEEELKACFDRANRSDFLTGRKFPEWAASFEWIIAPIHIESIINGKYDDYTQKVHMNSRADRLPHRFGTGKCSADVSPSNSSFDPDEFAEAAFSRGFDE